MEARKTHSSNEEEAHRPTKQLKIGPAPNQGPEMGEVQQSEPRAWLPTPMLGGEPLTDDASIRDYNGGIDCQVASALEETLLLLKDMMELRGLRRNKVFLQAKRCLGMVCIATLLLLILFLLLYFFLIFYFFIFKPPSIFFFFLNRLFKARLGWKKFTIPSHSSWRRREEEGLLRCRRCPLLRRVILTSRKS